MVAANHPQRRIGQATLWLPRKLLLSHGGVGASSPESPQGLGERHGHGGLLSTGVLS